MNIETVKLIKNLRKRNHTYEAIGKLVGLSKQRIHQILTGYVSPAKKLLKPQTFYIDVSTGEKYDTEGIKLEGRDFLREIVRRRDGYICQSCYKQWHEGERRLDVHHLDKELEGENGRLYCNCKDLGRMITLCHKCHMNLKHIREKMMKRYKKYGQKNKTKK